MATIIIGIFLVLLVCWAIWRIYVKTKKGGGCCGDHEEVVKKMGVADKNKKHYPYQCTMLIGGMTCENCARRVENALNELPGVWASVDISNKQATLRLKNRIDSAQIQSAVASVGYTVLNILEG